MSAPTDVNTTLLVALLAVAAIAAVVLAFLLWKSRYTAAVRRDALARSQAVIGGKVFEHLVPHLPGFGFDPRDARFLGSPVDFVVFDGLAAGNVDRVVFVEVKTGQANLSARERTVRDAVRDGRVEWREVRATARDANVDAPDPTV